MGELPGAYTGHHALVVRAVGILGGIACILKDHAVGDVEGILGVVNKLFSLNRQAGPVHLILRRYPYVDGGLQRSHSVGCLFSWFPHGQTSRKSENR